MVLLLLLLAPGYLCVRVLLTESIHSIYLYILIVVMLLVIIMIVEIVVVVVVVFVVVSELSCLTINLLYSFIFKCI